MFADCIRKLEPGSRIARYAKGGLAAARPLPGVWTAAALRQRSTGEV